MTSDERRRSRSRSRDREDSSGPTSPAYAVGMTAQQIAALPMFATAGGVSYEMESVSCYLALLVL